VTEQEDRSTEAPVAVVGAPVEVRSDFSGRWVPGFAVEETGRHGVRLRRRSDRHVLPEWFPAEVVRPANR
jgi:hypothetical protein